MALWNVLVVVRQPGVGGIRSPAKMPGRPSNKAAGTKRRKRGAADSPKRTATPDWTGPPGPTDAAKQPRKDLDPEPDDGERHQRPDDEQR